MSTTSTVRAATFDLLRRLGLTVLFGNPGSTEETFLTGFPDDFRFILALHEASAVAMADGYAQATRRPAVVNVHTAAGLGNAMGNIVTAFLNRTPLIITAGQQTREMLLMEPWLTNVEPESLPRPWVKWSYQPVRAEDVPAAFMRAYAVATQPPAGPVFLSLPMDDWAQPAAGVPVVRTVSTRTSPDPERLRDFAGRLAAASRPALVFGAGIARGQGWEAAIALAERTASTVYAAPACERTPFPEDHEQYAGALPFAIGPLSEKLHGHDVVLVIGAPVFRYYPFVAGPYLPDGTELLHITDDPAEAARAPVGDSLLSDPVLATLALTALVPTSTSTVWDAKIVEHQRASQPAKQDGDEATPLTAQQVFTTLRAALPADTILVEESPSNLAELRRAWPVTLPDSFYTFASGGLGWNVPASVGIALAEQRRATSRRLLAVIGDGSFQYSVQAIWTAAQHQLPVIFVVLRNDEYAILKSFAGFEGTPDVPGLELPGIEVTAIATGYGCAAVRAVSTSALREAIVDALDRPGPTVIEVPISRQVPDLM